MLGSGYPRELSGVARHLNALLVGERKRVARYRDTLGNLAHGLKTPLAVMRSALHSDVGVRRGHADDRDGDRPHDGHHRASVEARGGFGRGASRAGAGGGGDCGGGSAGGVAQGVLAQGSVDRAGDPGRESLHRRSGRLRRAARQSHGQRLQVVSGESPGGSDGGGRGLTLVVEDDGPGIAEENRTKVLERGARTDENVPGYGLGLAMVHDTVDLYGGKLAVEASILAGTVLSVVAGEED